MSKKQMLINYAPGEECRVALVEDGQLEEFHSERAGSLSFVGNVYVGRVMNVEAAIQAAFVDFGGDSNGFLHVSDIHPRYFPGGDDDTTEKIGRKIPRRERPPIQRCLKKGQQVVVQVLKEGINTKGPTLTSYISIPGRYLVMLPDMDRVGVSRRVEDEDERRSMRKVLDSLELPEGFGFILRTAGEGKGKTELKRDLAYLQRLWKDIDKRLKGGAKPRVLYAESDLMMRALRDVWSSEIDEIVVDNDGALSRAGRFMRIVSPRSSTKLLHYDRSAPMFHAYGIEEQLARIQSREVPLPSGGSLVIDETEAMIAIDVNSGRMRHHGDAETTAYRTNLEAVDEICRQLRLRDIGGLVLCDLIDMMSRSHRRTIEQRFKDRLKGDRAASKTLPISQFGIVEMTRQRQKQSLRNTHYANCPECAGGGVLKRPDSVANDAMRELAAILEHDKIAKIELVVSPRVAGALLSKKRQSLSRLERLLHKTVDVRVSEDIPTDRVNFYAYDESGADVDRERLPRPSVPKDLPVWSTKAGGGSADDWAVDVLREEREALEELPPEPEAEQFDDLMSGPIEPALDDEEASSSRATTKKKRRRGRRGGRGRRRKETAASESDAPAEDDAQTNAQESETEPERETQPSSKSRSSRRKPESKPVDQEMKTQPISTPTPAAQPGLRGDSWDITPAELAPAIAKTPEQESVASENGEAPKARPKRKRPSRSRKKAASTEGEANSDQRQGDEPSPGTSSPSRSSQRPRKKSSSKNAATKKKPRSARKKAASKESEPEPVSSDVPPTPVVKPKRSLYGSRRRKLRPGEIASISHDD